MQRDAKPTDAKAQASNGLSFSEVVRNSALVLALLGMVWLAFNVKLPSVDEIRSTFESWGAVAWVAFVLIYAVVATTPIPVSIMAITGGVVFGVAVGSVFSVIGALLGSLAGYWLARVLGKETVIKLLGKHGATVQERLANSSVESVYLLRVMPGVPYWPVNYGSGAFGVSQRDFLLGSIVSTIPGQVSLVAIGAFVAKPGVLEGVVVAIAWAVVLVMTIFAYRNLRRVTAAKKAESQ